MSRAGEKIPIILLTGFLGSGKTTLLGNLLHHPDFKDTAVVVNEIGTVGLDHHLVQGASESVLVLENGCVCCTARDDLASVLAELFWNRLYRKIPRFSRVVIETTGIATPGPIAQTITGDPLVLERFRLNRVVTTVDALQVGRQIADYREVVEQIMGADLLLVTKTDLADPAALAALKPLLHSLNPSAEIAQASMGDLAPDLVFGAPQATAGIVSRTVHQHDHAQDHGHDHDHDHGHDHDHDHGHGHGHDHRHDAEASLSAHGNRIHQITARIDAPPPQAALVAALGDLMRDPEAGLVRIKGIVRPSDSAEAMVIQAAGDIVHPLVAIALPEWNSGPGFLTLIGTQGDFAVATACLDRLCAGGWHVMAAGEEFRGPKKASLREKSNVK